MRKRILTMLLAASVLATSITYIPDGNVVWADEVATQEVNVEDFEYYELNNDDEDGVVILGYHGDDANLVIPEEIDGKAVLKLGEYVPFSGNENIKSIHIPSTVTTIAGFQYCSGLETITVAEGNKDFTVVDGILYNIEKTELICCFSDSDGEVVVPNGVIEIKSMAFNNCEEVTKITLPKSVKKIDVYSYGNTEPFYLCQGIAEIVVDEENEVYSSEDGILYNKDKTYIYACPKAKSGVINIPEGVKTVGVQAFYGCNKITNINIPKSVTTIESRALWNCSSATAINVNADNENYASEDGILYEEIS